MTDTLYKKHLLELYSEKPNFGHLEEGKTTHTVSMKNPSCNDEIIIELEIADGKVIDARFSGVSCFVSVVSACAILENIKGMSVEKVKSLSKEDVDKFLGSDITQTRINCQLMPLEALKKLK